MLGWSLSIPGAILLHQQLNFWSCCCPQVWLPCRKVSAIPGDDLQKYHQMIQAANQTLSLTCFRSFFLDGTFRARHDFSSLLELFLHNSFFFWDCPVKRRILVENSFTINFYQLSLTSDGCTLSVGFLWEEVFCTLRARIPTDFLSIPHNFLGASRWPAKRQIVNNWSWIEWKFRRKRAKNGRLWNWIEQKFI